MDEKGESWSVPELQRLVESRAGSRLNGTRVWHWEGELVAVGTGRVLAGLEGVETVRLLSPLQKRERLIQRAEIDNGRDIAVVKDDNNSVENSKPADPVASAGGTVIRRERSNNVGSGIGRMDERDGLDYSAKVLGRKLFFYKDPDSKAFLTNWAYRPTAVKHPVSPIVYPFQVLTYGLKKDRAVIWSETSVGAKVRATAMRLMEAPRQLGKAMTLSIAYLSNKDGRSTPNNASNHRRRIQIGASKVNSSTGSRSNTSKFVEKFDFVLDKQNPAMFWMRHGKCPSWYGGGSCVTYMRATQKRSWMDLPKRLVEKVEELYPDFVNPPRDVEEIRKYQFEKKKQIGAMQKTRKRFWGII